MQEQQPEPVASSSSKKPTAKILMIVLLALLVGGVIFGFVLQQRALKDAKSHSDGLEKRISALEEADNFAEKQVKKDRYQAVFLTDKQDEQVYFGKITAITKDTLKLEDIYYLGSGAVDRSGESVPETNVSLIKLGEEFHGPEDVMIIERKNIFFWENLKPDGEVSKAINSFEKSGNE